MGVKKISVSIEAAELKWLRQVARSRKQSVSSLLSEATRLLRQLSARRALLADVGEVAALSLARIQEIEREWKD